MKRVKVTIQDDRTKKKNTITNRLDKLYGNYNILLDK